MKVLSQFTGKKQKRRTPAARFSIILEISDKTKRMKNVQRISMRVKELKRYLNSQRGILID